MKIIFNISMILFIVFQSNLIAQPILTSQNISPTIGEVFNLTHGHSFNPGPSGINQNWNAIPTATTFTFQNNVILPLTTPYDTSFLNANFSIVEPTGPSIYYAYNYYQSSINEIKYIGSSSNSSMIQYIDAEDILRFPFNYGDSYTDIWTAKRFDYSINAYDSYITTGTTTVTYDGVGTITTPSGSYTNASRIHITRTLDTPYYHEYRDGYKWYLDGNHQPIATTYTVNQQIPGNPSYSESDFLNNVVVSAPELNEPSRNIIVYPNPAINQINFIFDKIQVISFTIIDLTGKIIHYKDYKGYYPKNYILLDTTEFSDGIYFVNFKSTEGEIVTKKISILK